MIEAILKFSIKKWLASKATDLLRKLEKRTDLPALVAKIEYYMEMLNRWYLAISKFLKSILDKAKDGQITEDEIDQLEADVEQFIEEIG